VPPVGVYAVAGCGVDLFINICLTILGYAFLLAALRLRRALLLPLWKPLANTLSPRNSYFPGHLHAFYLEYVYYDRREQAREGRFTASRAPGIYSERVQAGGNGYGTIVQPTH
jgi:uncharacterized membrane protein YqaE (UPF0057 family)